MTTAHTPAPWKTYRLSPDSDTKERLIAVTEDGETEICGVIHNEADAPLIAAAPALLNAALLVIDRWTHGDLAEAVRMLDAAAATARGGSI